MFFQIGKKIKALAKVLCWIGIISSILTGLTVIIIGAVFISRTRGYAGGAAALMIVFGLLIALIGSLASWLGSFKLYGYGELVDMSMDTEQNTREAVQLLRMMAYKDGGAQNPSGQYYNPQNPNY